MTEIYTRGVVIANGIPDSDGDVLNKKEIKTLLTKYRQDTDTMHTYIKNEGVEVIENWITETPTLIAGQNVPAGSWCATCKITNEELIQSILQKKLNAYSLGSVPQEAMTEKYWFINKSMTYSDVSDIDNIQPLFISFVDKGANGFDFEVMDKEVYINKNDKNVDDIMEEKIDVEEKFSLSTLEKLREFFSINKSEDTAVAVEPPVTEPVAETEPADNTDFLEQVKNATKEGILEGLKEAKELEEEIKEEAEEVEEKVEEEVEKVKEEIKPAETETETETEPTVEDVKINKRETVKDDNITVTENESNFYKMTRRDSFGCKIRK